MMPTIKRRENERERALEKVRMARIVACTPRNCSSAEMAMTLSLAGDMRNWAFHNTNLVKFDADGQPYRVAIHPEKVGNDKRKSKRREDALKLKEKHLEHWKVRGGAKAIAIAEGMDITKNDNAIRKIQKYIVDF